MTTYTLIRDGKVVESTTDYRRANTYYALCEINPSLSVTVE